MCTPKRLVALAVAMLPLVTYADAGVVTAERLAPAVVTVAVDPITLTTPIEPANSYDPRDDKGTIQDVCFAYGRTDEDVRAALLLPGTQAASAYMRTIFKWAGRGTLGQCREILRSDTNENCDGDIYPDPTPYVPDPPLHFYSDCWSNHAQGRASDFRVGEGLPGRKRIERGNLIIEWLLAPDAAGNKQARARRLGIQEIIFFDRCWITTEPADLEVTTYAQMRECGSGHFDHVHLSFTVDGALGLTSGYSGGIPPRDCAGCQPNRRPLK